MPKYLLLLAIALLGASCSGDRAANAWYFTYLRNVKEYEALSEYTKALADRNEMSRDTVVVLSGSLIALVDSVEQQLLLSAGQEDIRISQATRPGDMDKLMDYSISTELLIGPDVTRPVMTPLSAQVLKARIDDYAKKISGSSDELWSYYRTILSTGNELSGEHEPMVPWVIKEFYHMPLISVLNKLNDIKIRIRYIEMQAITHRADTRS